MSDFIAAFCVGVGQVAIGHPFDTTKILIQNNRKWLGLPVKDYYRGWKFPMTSAVILNCMTFPIVERTKPYTQNNFMTNRGDWNAEHPTPAATRFPGARAK